MIKSKSPILKGNYTIYKDKLIGKGKHSTTYECIDKMDITKGLCAKIIHNVKLNDLMEFEQLKSVNHKNLVKYYDFFIHQQDVIVIQEKCDSSLKTFIEKKKLQEEDVWDLINELVYGCQKLQSENLKIRDLKPANVLVRNNTYKISNYGLFELYKQIDGEIRSYAAPEIFYQPQQTLQKDIFSLGLVIYYSYFNCLPYTYREAGDQIRYFTLIKQNGFTSPNQLPERLQYLLQQMIVYEENERITLEDLSQQISKE